MPQAHVEASSLGRVVLAGVLLKLGLIGLYRFALWPALGATSFLCCFILFGGLLRGWVALCQVDLKAIIAYSRVCHMSVPLGLLALSSLKEFNPALLLLLGHGYVRAAIFGLISSVYKYVKRRSLLLRSGLLTLRGPMSSF